MVTALTHAQYAALFRATPVALMVFDRDLLMTHANPAYLAATAKDLDEIRGRYVFDVFPNSPVTREGYDQAASLEGVMRAAVTTGLPQLLAEYRYDIPLAAGEFEVRYWNVNEIPVLDDAGEVDLVLHFTEDVTHLVREREARDSARRLNVDLQRRVAAAQLDLRQRAAELEVLNLRLQQASAHDRSTAEALQLAMLTTLPAVEPLRLTARYRAAAVGDRVGGDWYDALALRDGKTAVAIGDVSGHDIFAAAVMGQLRSMLRAFAWASEEPPSLILRQLDRAMRDLQVQTYASAVLATFERTDDAGARRVMRWTNAGHPAPILLRPDGTSVVLDDGGPAVMLGVLPETRRPDHEVVVEPGSAVLFYTDGLVELRGTDLLDRTVALRASLERHHTLTGAARVDAVMGDMLGAELDDDVAVLLVELAVTGDFSGRLATSGPTGDL
ncbi:Serine phosphatase RsbU, regulator of sigma subunit [Jatrophihabitans endophyticus]|uniref:Serine phosphatase RsbU, regulator of sigma subunit n=1 Tax=Jatrophihabitans endophyticus TaxID=1206085 RepID=A0A1M5KMB8_9ACTN|nr:SpoIIE family protein phosphatase [Jatrophihabitans endophyticus]SHG53856.1 Serine phosphatase RsbU, regulator of sigma subunit [Jatrophihabitans endophyticus]